MVSLPVHDGNRIFPFLEGTVHTFYVMRPVRLLEPTCKTFTEHMYGPQRPNI